MKHNIIRYLVLSVVGLSMFASTTIIATHAHAASVIPAPAAIVRLLPSPYSDVAQAPNTFTGDAAEWAVAIVTGGNEALVYLCDGKNVGQWFGATVAKGLLTGTALNGSVAKAALKSGAWSGTVSLKGKPVAFTAKAATPKNGWGVWRVKPSPDDGPDYVVGWISTSKGIRGIAQTSTGKVASGVVATVNSSGQATLNGAPLVILPNPIPLTTIAGQVLSAQIAGPPTTTVPPETTKLCLRLMIAHAKAYRAFQEAKSEATSSGNPIDPDAVFGLSDASTALNNCQTGLVAT